jgi:hypothetical protein
MERVMFSLIGMNFPTLVLVVVSVFAVILFAVSISENRHAQRASRRQQAADRTIPSSNKVESR